MLKIFFRPKKGAAMAVPITAFGILSCLLISTFFQNCSQTGFKVESSLEAIPISASCGSRNKVTQEEMFKLIHEGHQKTSAEDKVRCPGFFAEIDSVTDSSTGQEKISNDLASQQKLISEANGCNVDGPPGDATTPGETSSTPSKETLIRELVNKTNSNNILVTMTKLSDGTLGPTRYHASSNPRRVPQWIMDEFKRIAQGRTDIRIRLVEHTNTAQPSVEAIIDGSGPDKNKFVIIGGHEDSINGTSSLSFVDSVAPGADDNASGVATVLETFKVLVESGLKPNASIAFYTYAAEEVGLVGSQEIARSYSNAGKEVLGVIQVDMSAYSSGAIDEFTFITDYTSATLTSTAADLASKFLGMKVSYDTCGYACSDHASWTRYNYRAILPAEKEVGTSVKRIHTVQDKVDALIKPAYAEKFAKLCVAFALTLGFE